MNGSVTVPVEQIGTARLAGALGRAEDVEDVVEQLKGEADLAAEARQRVLLGPGALGADHAGALEEGGGLQPAAVHVALGGDLDVEGVAALRQLAAGQGDRGAGEQLDLAAGVLCRDPVAGGLVPGSLLAAEHGEGA